MKKIDIRDSRVIKFICQHIINIYNVLYCYKLFATLTINNFLEKNIFRKVQYKKKAKININHNSNALFEKYKEMFKVKNNNNNNNFIANSQDKNETNIK